MFIHLCVMWFKSTANPDVWWEIFESSKGQTADIRPVNWKSLVFLVHIYASNASQWFTVKILQKRGFLPRGIMALAKRRDRVGSWATSLAWNYSEMLYAFFCPRVLLEFIWDLRPFISAWTITHYRCDQELSCIFRQVLKIYPLCNIDIM